MLPLAPWLWMRSKPSAKTIRSNFFRLRKKLRPGSTWVSMPNARASWVKGPSVKQTIFTWMRGVRPASRVWTWVLAPPVSPPLIKWRIFMGFLPNKG